MEENRTEIVQKLYETLKLTRAGENIILMEYDEAQECVRIKYRSGYGKLIDVSADSGVALIKDVMYRVG